jgi:D-amino-acid dehydrogenase
VIGLACAYYLDRAGYTVTVIEQETVGGACSQSNCGYICPCHVLPLNEPGAIWTSLKSMLRPNSPFKVKPRMDPALWQWLYQFAIRCRHGYMLEAGRALQTILEASMEEYNSLMESEHFDCEWRKLGLLYVLRSAQGFDAQSRTDDLLSREFGIQAKRMNGTELHAMDPGYRNDLAGAFLYEEDASLNPARFTAALRSALEKRGVTLLEHCSLEAIRKQSGKVTALVTGKGELPATHVVLATGALSPHWQKALEVKLPIQPGKGYSITTDMLNGPTYPALLPEHRVGLSPLKNGLRVGSMMEFTGYDSSIPQRRLELLRSSANEYLAQPLATTAGESWYGWRPMTYDSLPIIGPTPHLSNAFVATGHGMLGMSLAPVTGRLIAELVSGGKPHIDPSPYRANRFQ